MDTVTGSKGEAHRVELVPVATVQRSYIGGTWPLYVSF